jgi:ectoine hydroxylase-related dioxygenase (phytanoyl-CoA dioxygenase family)
VQQRGAALRVLVDSTPIARDPAALRKRAAEDGCLLLRGLPGPEVVAPVRMLVMEAAESLGLLMTTHACDAAPLARDGAELTGTGYDDPRWLALQERVLGDPRFAAVGDHVELLNVLATVFGDTVLTRRGDICRVALPRAPHLTTPAHQDHWYTGGSTNVWTAWIALTDTPLALGPLAVMPGSHVCGLLPHSGQGAGRQGVHGHSDAQFAAAPLAAGDAILFNCLTVHRALPNMTSDRVRISVDYRYQPASEPITVVRLDGTRAGS